MRDLTQFQCPQCGTEDSSSSSRTCRVCGYHGDWIQPGEVMTFAENKARLGVESISELVPELVQLANKSKVIAKPTVHLNGTSRAELSEQFANVYQLLGEVIGKLLSEVYPNARDYYVQSPEAYPQAKAEHLARLATLRDLREEYLQLFDSVQES